jgi:hypothetical protein
MGIDAGRPLARARSAGPGRALAQPIWTGLSACPTTRESVTTMPDRGIVLAPTRGALADLLVLAAAAMLAGVCPARAPCGLWWL